MSCLSWYIETFGRQNTKWMNNENRCCTIVQEPSHNIMCCTCINLCTVHRHYYYFVAHTVTVSLTVWKMSSKTTETKPVSVWCLTFLCSWRLWAPTLKPGNWFMSAVSLLRIALISVSTVERNAPPCLRLYKAAQCRRSLDSVKGQSRHCWHCPVCVYE